jgi:CBS domain-containing protein
MGVSHVARIMLDRRVSGLPVTDDEGCLVGMITEGDLMGRFELGSEPVPSPEASPDETSEERARAYLKSYSWKTGDVMTPHVVTIEEGVSLGEVARVLEEHGIKRVPVMREGQLVGIVSRADLLHGLLMPKSSQTPRGDAPLRLGILTRLREDAGIGDEFVDVTVLDGVVHLWGRVRSRAERDVARVVAENIRGAEGVENHLRVVPAPSDRERTNRSPPATAVAASARARSIASRQPPRG